MTRLDHLNSHGSRHQEKENRNRQSTYSFTFVSFKPKNDAVVVVKTLGTIKVYRIVLRMRFSPPFFTLLTITSAAFESKKGEASSTFCNTYSEMSVGHAKWRVAALPN